MCGMFTRVTVDESITIPYLPKEIERPISWQSKQGLDVYGGSYRVTADGRLEKKQQSWREKTDEEKQAEAEKWGFDSWDAYVRAYEEQDELLYPDEIDYDPEVDGYDDAPPVGIPREQKVDETWWGDVSFHGTFEIHHMLREDPVDFEEFQKESGETVKSPQKWDLNVFLEYELRFTEGDLDEIVFTGPRMSDKSREEVITELREWTCHDLPQ